MPNRAARPVFVRAMSILLSLALMASLGGCAGPASPPALEVAAESFSADRASAQTANPPQATSVEFRSEVPLAPPPAPPKVSGPVPAAWAAAPEHVRNLAPPEISARAAVVLDEGSTEVLYDKNAHESLPPASLTKIVTAILALERGDLDAWVDIDVDGLNMGRSTVMGIVPGDRFRLRDLLYGLMLPSGNDAALAIGRHISGSDEAFVSDMNALPARLGLSESSFNNPHGLGGPTHAMSAYDLAMFSRYAMRIPGFAEIVTAPNWNARGTRTIGMWNINSFLYGYRGADGVKTGYTRSAGNTLVASASRNGHRLYAVVLNAPARDADARRLLDWAFAEYRWPEGSQP